MPAVENPTVALWKSKCSIYREDDGQFQHRRQAYSFVGTRHCKGTTNRLSFEVVGF
jgi:hypothetical protein